MKRVTRREIREWLAPIRFALKELRTGEVACIDDVPVTRIDIFDEYERTDWCIRGWVGCLSRLFPNGDFSPMERLGEALANDQGVTFPEIDAASRLLNEYENRMVGLPWKTVRQASIDEQIAVEFAQQGLLEAA